MKWRIAREKSMKEKLCAHNGKLSNIDVFKCEKMNACMSINWWFTRQLLKRVFFVECEWIIGIAFSFIVIACIHHTVAQTKTIFSLASILRSIHFSFNFRSSFRLLYISIASLLLFLSAHEWKKNEIAKWIEYRGLTISRWTHNKSHFICSSNRTNQRTCVCIDWRHQIQRVKHPFCKWRKSWVSFSFAHVVFHYRFQLM